MNTAIISEAARGTLDGTLSFPEVVARLPPGGRRVLPRRLRGPVQAVLRRRRRAGGHGDRVRGLPPIAAELDVAGLRAAILDSQRGGQKWRDFTRRAMTAGVQSYYAFLRGRRVTYLGRAGDQHTEWFPGAEPRAGGHSV